MCSCVCVNTWKRAPWGRYREVGCWMRWRARLLDADQLLSKPFYGMYSPCRRGNVSQMLGTIRLKSCQSDDSETAIHGGFNLFSQTPNEVDIFTCISDGFQSESWLFIYLCLFSYSGFFSLLIRKKCMCIPLTTPQLTIVISVWSPCFQCFHLSSSLQGCLPASQRPRD